MIIEAITGKAVPQNMEALVHTAVDLINAFDGICNVSRYCKDFHVKGDLHVYKKSDKSYFDRRC